MPQAATNVPVSLASKSYSQATLEETVWGLQEDKQACQSEN
jgi:hypothetical protein